MSMQQYLDNLAAVQAIIEKGIQEPRVINSAKALQAVLLRAALATVHTPRPRKDKLEHGLTKEEASHAKREGGKIPAIKLFRERTRCGLKEAKDAVEAYMQKVLGFMYWPTKPATPVLSPLVAEECELARNRYGKQRAIEDYHARNKCSWEDAQKKVEEYMKDALGFTTWYAN